MRQKNIIYKGISRNLSNISANEGDLAECVNLVSEDDVKPVVWPDAEFKNHEKIIYVHKTSSGDNFITYKEGIIKAFKVVDGAPVDLGLTYPSPEPSQVTVIGNTVIISSDAGISHLIYKDDTYKVLGNKPPFIPLSFGLFTSIKESEQKKIDVTAFRFQESDLTHVFSSGNKIAVTNGMIPLANKLIGSLSNDYFIYPFLLRYAYRLYDGSLTLHSAPILMIPSSGISPVGLIDTLHYKDSDVEDITAHVSCFAGKLTYKTSKSKYDINQILNEWGDIVKSIDVFVSKPIYTYDQNGYCEKIYTASADGYPDFSIGCLDKEEYVGEYVFAKNTIYSKRQSKLLIEMPSKDNISEEVQATSIFYKVASLNLSTLKDNELKEIETSDLDSITLGEVMTDDYNSHDDIYSKYLFAYNSRLNLSGVSRFLYDGFPADSMVTYANGRRASGDKEALDYDVSVTVYINTSDGENVVEEIGTMNIAYFGYYMYYPNPNAYKMVLERRDYMSAEYAEIPLKEHKFLNGAYYFGGFKNLNWSTTEIQTKKVKKKLSEPNKIYTSELNNPFIFNPENIYTVGTGEIIGLSAATKALSQGQFGQFPMYAFTTDGIWALEVSSTGTYSSKQAVSRDVCNNPRSITQTDNAIIFTTDKGLMVLAGSESICISETMDGKHFRADSFKNIAPSPEISEMVLGISDNVTFREFIKTCRIAYDYPNQRIILDSGLKYQYVYSLRTQTFARMFGQANIANIINSFPECYVQIFDEDSYSVYDISKVVDENKVTERNHGLIITRPLLLDSEGLKSIIKMIHRGTFKSPSYVKAALYGSRDGVSFYRLNSLRGMGFKYFVVVLYTYLLPTERLVYSSFMVEDRFLNKMR